MYIYMYMQQEALNWHLDDRGFLLMSEEAAAAAVVVVLINFFLVSATLLVDLVEGERQ